MRSCLPAVVSALFLAVAMAPEAIGGTASVNEQKGVNGAPAAAPTDSTGLPATAAPSRGFFGDPGSGGGAAFFHNQSPSNVPYIVGAGAVGVAAGKALLGHKDPKGAAHRPTRVDHPSPGIPPKPELPPRGQDGVVSPPSPPETTPEEKPSTPPEAPEPGTLALVTSAAALLFLRRRNRS